jgi:hypothetical protein
MCMRNVFPTKPTDVIHLALSFLHKWKVLMKELEMEKVDNLVAAMMQFMINFNPLNTHPCDVGFI